MHFCSFELFLENKTNNNTDQSMTCLLRAAGKNSHFPLSKLY